MLLQGLCVYNYNHICEVLQIKTMTEAYDDRSAQTVILLKTMYLKKFWCFQHNVNVKIGIREHFYQDFRAKLASDPIFVQFFTFYSLLLPDHAVP